MHYSREKNKKQNKNKMMRFSITVLILLEPNRVGGESVDEELSSRFKGGIYESDLRKNIQVVELFPE